MIFVAPECARDSENWGCSSGFDGYLGNVRLIAVVATIAIRGVALV